MSKVTNVLVELNADTRRLHIERWCSGHAVIACPVVGARQHGCDVNLVTHDALIATAKSSCDSSSRASVCQVSHLPLDTSAQKQPLCSLRTCALGITGNPIQRVPLCNATCEPWNDPCIVAVSPLRCGCCQDLADCGCVLAQWMLLRRSMYTLAMVTATKSKDSYSALVCAELCSMLLLVIQTITGGAGAFSRQTRLRIDG